MKQGNVDTSEDFFAEPITPKNSAQPKTIADSLGGSPTKKVALKFKVERCKSKAVLAHKDEDGDHAVALRRPWQGH